jgi:hypothetical protein
MVFNSMSGYRLASLITGIGVFVPKDSYEFVHTQLAQFQNKVDEAVPGQTPEALRIQSSDTMQQMLAQLQQTKGNSETGTTSLLTALSKWWGGSKEETATETAAVTPQSVQQSVQNSTPSSSPATTYVPPLLSQINPYMESSPQTAAPQPTVPPSTIAVSTVAVSTVAVEPFFVQRAEPIASSVPTTLSPLTALLPSAPTTSPQQLTTLTPLTLTEALPILSEATQLLPMLPTLPAPQHVGSDLLLRNSTPTQQTLPSTPARVFRAP